MLIHLHLDEGIFCRVRRLAWCNDPESYTGCSVAIGRATLARTVKGEHPDKERYTGPTGWGQSIGQLPITGKKKTHKLKKPGQGIGKTDGLSNKRQKPRKRLMNCGIWNVQGIRGKMAEKRQNWEN